MEGNFDNLVNYAICESLYLQKGKANYITFNGLCQNIKDSIVNEVPFTTEICKVLDCTMVDIMILYGFNIVEIGPYINNFFINDKWLEYTEMVIILKNNTQNSFQ